MHLALFKYPIYHNTMLVTGSLFFFQLVTGQLTCLNVETSQVNKVAKLQKAKVKAYPYYTPGTFVCPLLVS